MLPIFYCKAWDVWCLLDTGINSTVIGNNVVEKFARGRNYLVMSVM